MISYTIVCEIKRKRIQSFRAETLSGISKQSIKGMSIIKCFIIFQYELSKPCHAIHGCNYCIAIVGLSTLQKIRNKPIVFHGKTINSKVQCKNKIINNLNVSI